MLRRGRAHGGCRGTSAAPQCCKAGGGRTDPRRESSESSAGTLDISLPGWAAPPLQKALRTLINKLFTQPKRTSAITRRDLFLAAQTHPSSTKLGGCSLICICPLGYSPIQRGFVPLFSQAPGMGQLGEAPKTFAWFPAAPQTRQQTFVSPSLRLCRQVPNSRQQFLPIRPRCPDTEDLVRQASQQTASALSNPPPSNSKRYAN